MHAREWVSPAAVAYVLDKLTSKYYSLSEEMKTVADTFDWYILPLANPDGM